jgi:hypothetical protein
VETYDTGAADAETGAMASMTEQTWSFFVPLARQLQKTSSIFPATRRLVPREPTRDSNKTSRPQHQELPALYKGRKLWGICIELQRTLRRG